MFRTLGTSLAVVLLAAAAAPSPSPLERPPLAFPRIKEAGGIAVLPEAFYQPKAGTKVVFDIAVGAKPDEINKGLDRIARLINLHAGHGVPADGPQIVAVLHGSATDASLSDEAYKIRTGAAANPNLPLLRRFNECGVKLYVCGQTLAQKRISPNDVAPHLEIAVSAMLVNVQSQADGFAVLAVQ